MKKTVIFEFPDDFKFPKYCWEKNTTRENPIFGPLPKSTCDDCPFCDGDEYSFCFLTGDCEDEKPEKRKKCPFYSGAETVNYNDC